MNEKLKRKERQRWVEWDVENIYCRLWAHADYRGCITPHDLQSNPLENAVHILICMWRRTKAFGLHPLKKKKGGPPLRNPSKCTANQSSMAESYIIRDSDDK